MGNEKFIPVSKPSIGEEEISYITNELREGWVSIGECIPRFEEEFSKYSGSKYGVSVCNGTAALHLAIISLGIGEGDEVIVPVSTFIATANAVKMSGAKPVFVDISEDNWTIDYKKIEEKITDRTRAIIPVHLYGIPCDMDEIMEIARRNKLYVIEDCAEAHGAKYKGKMVGSFGEIGCFSFFGNKIITTGEGGMCITNNKELKNKMDLLKTHGMKKEKRYWHEFFAYNYCMSNIQAALGVAQLKKIDSFIKKRKEISEKYKEFLKVKGISFIPTNPNKENVYWMNVILTDKKDEIVSKLKENNIDSRPFFYPINKMPPYFSNEKFPVAEKFNKKGINLPSYTDLSYEDINKICEIIKGVLK